MSETQKEASDFVGRKFLATNVDVDRGGRTIRIAGGQMLDELREPLTAVETKDLTRAGLIRPATEAEGAAAASRYNEAGQSETVTAERQRLLDVDADYAAKRASVVAEHDNKKSTALAKLDDEYARTRAGKDATVLTPSDPHTSTSNEEPVQNGAFESDKAKAGTEDVTAQKTTTVTTTKTK